MKLNLPIPFPSKLKDNVCNSEPAESKFAPMETVKERREKLGITQKELAETCGCHPTTISHIERERELPSLLLFARMADELKCSPTRLLELLKVRTAKVTDLQNERERRSRR